MLIWKRVAKVAIPLALVSLAIAAVNVRSGTDREDAVDASPSVVLESPSELSGEVVTPEPAPVPVDPGTAGPIAVDPGGGATMPGIGLSPVSRIGTTSGALAYVHDPTIVRAGGAWYAFSTGAGLPIRRSYDLAHWELVGEAFPWGLPEWVSDHVPGVDRSQREVWAPDVTYWNGRWYLYWSVGEFGTQDGVIGLATNTTLDPADPNYRWVDEGLVLASDGNDATMAIDPAAFTGPDGGRWLLYGSFWEGIFVRRLDGSGKLAAGAPAHNIARRSPRTSGIEAASVVYRDGWYWLFVSVGKCCKGLDSKYSIEVGRSQSVTGPYLDATGRDLLDNGGTTLTGSYGNMVGPGHGTVVADGSRFVMVHHYYDRGSGGVPTMMVRPIIWASDGWPLAPNTEFAPSAPASPWDAVGVWNVSGFPEERSDRRFGSVSVELRADGTVSPSGTWSVRGDRVVVEGLSTDSGVRTVWWVLDFGARSGFGRDDRTAAVRAVHN